MIPQLLIVVLLSVAGLRFGLLAWSGYRTGRVKSALPWSPVWDRQAQPAAYWSTVWVHVFCVVVTAACAFAIGVAATSTPH